MECIILAGGLGTRLKSTIGDYPKCMAPVNGKPFLHYIFQYLEREGCTRAVLSLGYKHDIVTEWLTDQELGFKVDHVLEPEPLGTGGGIKLAMANAVSESPIIVNGDTLFQVSMRELLNFHKEHSAEVTLSLKRMTQFSRYGSVQLGRNDMIEAFEEKEYKEDGLINGGVYCVHKELFLSRDLPTKFSFEKEYLEAYVAEQRFFGQVNTDYFIDIGVPEDYQQAQEDFKELFS